MKCLLYTETLSTKRGFRRCNIGVKLQWMTSQQNQTQGGIGRQYTNGTGGKADRLQWNGKYVKKDKQRDIQRC